ncbi:hypothetical protein [Sporosarcina phage Lietuvens]|nr:hypothetical protein [Sporosarcina phage Lietuvens]
MKAELLKQRFNEFLAYSFISVLFIVFLTMSASITWFFISWAFGGVLNGRS